MNELQKQWSEKYTKELSDLIFGGFIMYIKAMLKKQLEELGIVSSDTILVHSSMKKIGDVIGGADTVLDALSEYMQEGLLVLPTHTWKTISEEDPNFYVESSETCIGILTELFRKREHVVRSLHPTHSVAALGRDAVSYTGDDHKFDTPCAEGSSLWKLIGRKGKIVLIGVNFTSNTFIHGIEEWNDVPGRLTEDHEPLYAVKKDGTKISVPSRRHCGLDWSKHYWKVEEVLLERGTIKKGQFGDATVIVCDAEKLNQDISKMLQVDKALFTTNKSLTEEQVEMFIKKFS